MKRNTVLIVLVLLTNAFSMAQSVTTMDSVSVKRKRRFASLTVPVVLVTAGTLMILDRDADKFFLSNYEVREERNENFRNFSNHTDDYLQHVPSATMFVMSLAGVKGKHDLPNQAALFVKSELIMLTTVYSLKYTVGEGRPDTGQRNSFPSGHTAQAFTAASLLSKEYGHHSIWISIGAYSVATTVGVFRMMNNRHWISDVMVGAGIGILSTELAYRTHQDRWGKSHLRKIGVSPFSVYGSQGVSLSLKL